jgi:thiol-disulfide isomerase/thioredoxin
MPDLPRDGIVAIVKRECPTCVLTAPVLGELERRAGLVVYSQDDPAFPETVARRRDDTALEFSHRLGIAIVPTLIRFEEGREVARLEGWDRGAWERLAGLSGLGPDLPSWRPGCGARNVEPGVLERLKIRFGETGLLSRRIQLGEEEDEIEPIRAADSWAGIAWNCARSICRRFRWWACRTDGAAI